MSYFISLFQNCVINTIKCLFQFIDVSPIHNHTSMNHAFSDNDVRSCSMHHAFH